MNVSQNIVNYIKDIFLYHKEQPLLFTSLYFWVFFGIILGIYAIIYRKKSLRNIFLLFISLFFYWKTGGWFFTLLIYSAIINYFLGFAIFNTNHKVKSKLYLTLGLIANLGVLFYFKYSYFFTGILNSIFNTQFEVIDIFAEFSNAVFGTNFDIFSILLPVGVSFFTFQAISYIIDVYRGKIEPVKNFIDFSFYISFFPQLVAGPIVRASTFIPQLRADYKVTRDEFNRALFLIMNGLVKKMIISDYISINFVDRVFENPLAYSGFENLMAIYGYGIQIYCDFSGYTDIAIGVAFLLGFRLPLNFNSPYKAANITDFWRRWHISLSTWLRDYLYISLGGNRKGKIRMYWNILVVMLLGGLWHGASWQFVIWGAIHGIVLVAHKFFLEFFPKEKKSNWLTHFFSVFITFQIVQFAWLFFRAPDMNTVWEMLGQISSSFGWISVIDMMVSYRLILGLIFVAYIIHWLPASRKTGIENIFIKIPQWAKIILVIFIIFTIYQFKSSDIQPFIYFQF